MINRQFSLLISFFAVIYLTNANPASFITKCKASDSKCLKESTKAALPYFVQGIPELGIKPIDPFFLAKADASSENLKLVLTDIDVKGLKGCVIKKILREVEKSKLTTKLVCNIDLDGKYEMDGKLLFVPIKGKGKVHVTLRKLVINAEIDVEEIVKNGKKYWRIKNWNHSYDIKDKADVNFENLFSDNELLGRAARELIANNGNDIVNEVGPPVVKTIIDHAVDTIETFFDQVPLDDLVLE